MKLRASEQDADDQLDDQISGGNDRDDGDNTNDQHLDDNRDDGADDAGDQNSDDGEDNDAGEDRQRDSRRAIEERAAEARAERERLARERGELEGERRARDRADAERRRQDEDRREQEAMATMTEEQRNQYLLAKEVKVTKDNQAATNLLLVSSTDQNKFSRTMRNKPQYAKYEDEVEQRHQDALARGNFVQRDVLLAHLIGEKALQAKDTNDQKDRGKRRVQEQRGQRSSARGDRSSQGDNRGKGNVVSRAEREDWAI